jgi:Rrf2 family nitric oxide-sensitive transcriptional repressor
MFFGCESVPDLLRADRGRVHMRLTLQTDLALRALMYLGATRGQTVTIAQVAQRYRVAENHLMKVVMKLSRLGYVRTTRGHRGGVAIGRPPAEIRIGAVVRDLEEQFVLVECFDAAHNRCALTPACRLRPILGEALDAFFAVLDRYTLADLLGSAGDLPPLLGFSPSAPAAGRARLRRSHQE